MSHIEDQAMLDESSIDSPSFLGEPKGLLHDDELDVPRIQRAKVTYGRPKSFTQPIPPISQTPPELDTSTSFESTASSLMTPKSTDNEDLESETRLDERDDSEEQEPIVNHYSWRDKLKALDEQFDSDDDADMGGAPPASNEQLPRMESTPAKRSAPLFLASPASVAMDGSPHQSSSKSKPPPKSLPASSPEASTSDHVHDAASPTSNVRKAKRGQSKTSKPKPLTKKQMNETIRESARIQSDRRFDIPRPENQSIPYQHLLTGLRLDSTAPVKTKKLEFEDPIHSSSFREKPNSPQASASTSGNEETEGQSVENSPIKPPRPKSTTPQVDPLDSGDESGSEDDFLSLSAVLAKQKARKDLERATQRLNLVKEKALIRKVDSESDSDSEDLEITNSPPRKSAPDPRSVLQNASRHDSRSKALRTSHVDQKPVVSLTQMRAAAEPLFQHKSSRGPSGKPSQIRQHDMERFTLERAKEQANALTGKKEKEFVDRGGRLKKASETPLALEDVSTKVQGLLEAENVEADDEDDAMEDADWTPEKEDEDVSAMQDTEDGASRPSPPIVDESDDEDKENQPVPPTGLIDDEERHGHELPVRRSHAIPQVVDSDDEDQESLMPSSNILVPDTSMIDDTDIEDESLEPRSLFPELEETSNRASLFPLNAESSQYSTQGTKVDFEPIPLKATGLSQFFGTQQFKSGFLDRLEKIDDPMSPAPISQLLPAIEMSTQERAEEAEIFQEDQDERRRDVEFSQPPATKPPMYMTEGGFFTQTKPASQAMVPLMSNSGIQSQLSQQTPSIRPPLATLSWTENSPPSDAPLRRLRKGIRSPGNDDNDSVGPSPRRHSRPQSAEKKKQQKPKKPLGKSEYVMGEAEESDEEAEFGFGGHRKKDDEESGDEDANIVLADLVNDDAVNENIDLVRAKAKEHELADDERVQEKVQEVVDGKYRAKRRNRGVDLGSDEESDDDDEDDRRIRNKMRSKKRKIEGDELDIIAANPETAAFAQAYQNSLEPDNDGFEHLGEDHLTLVPQEDEENDEEDEEMEAMEVRDKLREIAKRPPQEREPIDVESVEWMNVDEPLATTSYRTVATSQPKKAPAKTPFGSRQSTNFLLSTSDQSKQWLQNESRASASSNRSGAVTGHAVRKPVKSKTEANVKPQTVHTGTTQSKQTKGQGREWQKKSAGFQ